MRLTIEALRGTWHAKINGRSEFADTLEDLLAKLAPDAPEAYVWHSGEVLGSILGAEAIEVLGPQVDFAALADAIFGAQDSPDHWQPTEAQCAYFEPADDDAQAFDPDTFPRGV